ncbi:hypothetical protein FHX81_1344 [Saccharothrix saharensis]|uniref:Uncharacterized protein n=1 Tax=Saccharothrix saharensis TaxID=571190 RepID=A0A543J8B4_9PSEU|nr:hypothetical protein [Saccharothrix saharensis]TQM79052.1 hypothetical protein FHX81_1344 [Saccharothrix saharensis]
MVGKSWDDRSGTDSHGLLADLDPTHRHLVVERLDLEPAGQPYPQVHLDRRNPARTNAWSSASTTLITTNLPR